MDKVWMRAWILENPLQIPAENLTMIPITTAKVHHTVHHIKRQASMVRTKNHHHTMSIIMTPGMETPIARELIISTKILDRRKAAWQQMEVQQKWKEDWKDKEESPPENLQGKYKNMKFIQISRFLLNLVQRKYMIKKCVYF